MATKTFGLIGYPLGHSFSRKFFTEKFANEGIDAEYLNFEIPDLTNLDEIFSNPQICGLNVTLPYKQDIMPRLDAINPDAEAIGSVNVIKFHRESGKYTTTGYNTDIIGFHDSIAPHLTGVHTTALILGTGGASKAVAHCFKKMGIEFSFVSRSAGNNRITYDELNDEVIKSHKIIVNATPLGMYPKVDACPEIPYEAITAEHVCFDLTYNPEETLFMRKAKQYGADTVNGMEMLIGQALAAWKIWND